VRLKGFRPDLPSIRGIYEVGFPTIVMQAIGTVMTLIINAILISFTETAVAVFGVFFRVQSFALMPLFGVTNASLSIMAYNYGACNRKRMMRTLKLTIVVGLVLMTVMTVIFLLIPEQILGLFNASEDMLTIGRPAFTIIPLGLVLASVSICCSTLFQAIGKGAYSMYISLARQLIVLVPVAWLLAHFAGKVSAVWWAFPIAEIFTLTISLMIFSYVYNNRIRTLQPADTVAFTSESAGDR
jgi:Na+-driven multidrug efflux pump